MTALVRLNSREKLLVALLFLVAVPLGLWFLVAQPLQDARARAIGALATAQADYHWVAAQDQQFRANAGASARPAMTPVGLAGLETALIDARLNDQVTTLEETSNRSIRLSLKAAAFADVGRFLELVERDLGYDIVDMQIAPADVPARIDASFGLMPH